MLAGRFRGIEEAERIVGSETLADLLATRPAAIIASAAHDSRLRSSEGDQASAA